MKIIIDRDSICMGDDFGHKQTIECSENETLESLMNRILQTDFFPVESLNKQTKKWKVKIDNQNILTFFPNKNKVTYHINKNTMINNLKSQNIYFKEIASNRMDFLELLALPFIFLFIILRSLFTYIFDTFNKLKQQKWTHIILPFYLLYVLCLVITIIVDMIINDFYYSYLTIIVGAALCPLLIYTTIFILILMKLLSIKFKNIDKTKNKLLLHNPIYNLLWLLGMFTLLYGMYIFITIYIPNFF